MNISELAPEIRPREKLLHNGPQALSDAESLSIFLRIGVQGLSAIELAQQLLDHFGSVQKLLMASQSEFCAIKGLGSAKYAQIQAILE